MKKDDASMAYSGREPIVSVEEVTFSYGESPNDAQILSGLTLDVGLGAICCLMGINGCGKSTLLDCVLGINAPRSGRVLVDGKPVGEYRPARLARKLSYVPQVHDRSFPYLVDHVVLMGRAAHQTGLASPSEEDEEIAYQALVTCGIEQLAKRPYTLLSGGEMQMTMLARALAQQTPLILMDEPTAHLDFKNELLFMETVARLANSGDVGVLMATHSPNQAFYFERAGVSTQVALMDGGHIRACGRPSDVLTDQMIGDVYGIDVDLLCAGSPVPEGVRQIVPKSIRSQGAAFSGANFGGRE